MAREINLVPDIKNEMIKTLKLRNFIFFLCIVVAAVGVSATVLVGLVMGGQQAALEGKKSTIDALSAKINSYKDLNDFLTIKDQLGNINKLTSNKQVLSRTFNILAALLPDASNPDSIELSELSVNLEDEKPTFSFDAQANAGREPFIDYNVLDSFKKSMDFVHYDYGDYVDKEGTTIPAYCMIETGDNGAFFKDETLGIYALWTIDVEGCDIFNSDDSESSDSATNAVASNAGKASSLGYEVMDYNNQKVVRIWRTPQFSKWYKANPKEGEAYMTLDGAISNVEHFASKCITYVGNTAKSSTNPTWDPAYECKLVPDGKDGISISDSSNGIGAGDELVLRFSATISLAPEVYDFDKHHVIAIPPSGRYNVTDSYVQVQAMFVERARDCAADDTTCNSTIIPDDTNTNSTKDSTNGRSGNG